MNLASTMRAPMARRTTFATLAAALAMLAVSATLATSPAAATTPNGCGTADGLGRFVPNAPLGYDFEGPCNQHDICYAIGQDRASCDSQFLADMQAVCADGLVCDGLAGIYYYFVRLFGSGAWDNAASERFDEFMNDLSQCADDYDCLHEVTERYDAESAAVNAPPSSASGDPTDAQPSPPEQGDPDPGDPPDDTPGDDGSYDGGGYDGGGYDGGYDGGGGGEFAVASE